MKAQIIASAVVVILFGYIVNQLIDEAEEKGYQRAKAEAATIAEQVAKTVAEETRRLQQANDNIARKYHESQIRAQETRTDLTNRIKRLHMERRVENGSCSDFIIPVDNLPERVFILQAAIDSSGLPDSNREPCIVKEAHEIETCYLQEIIDHDESKQQLAGLIDTCEPLLEIKRSSAGQ